MKKLTGIGAAVLAAVAAIATHGEAIMFQTDFAEGAKGWESTGNAFESSFSRGPAGGSIAIGQRSDEEAGSHWRSPAIAHAGGPVTISFWGAPNYTRCPDFSYSATVDVVSYDETGDEIRRGMHLLPVLWDEARQGPMSGPLLAEGLVWTYYEAVYHAPPGEFRLLFHWPREAGQTRGECHLTDVQVTAGARESIEIAGMTPSQDMEDDPPLTLEISLPVQGNLFYRGDPLRFEALVYRRDGDAPAIPDTARLVYRITDFQHFFIAEGAAPFDDAAPVADPEFDNHAVGRARRNNLHQPFTVADDAAGEAGRLFFIEVRLADGDRILARDTVTYGVVDPRPAPPAERTLDRRFMMSRWQHYFSPDWAPDRNEAIALKMGTGWLHILDYHWVRVQPEYPGPLNFGEPRPAFPKLSFCPNLEQIRGRPDDHPWGSIATMAPEGAQLPDPLRPGSTTFDIDAYVAYIVGYLRHHRDSIGFVVPSGLERAIDERSIELIKKSYTAIKAEFPDLPVGLMLYGLGTPSSGQTLADLFLAEKLYDYCDFIDDHMYAPSVDWSSWMRLQAAYRDMDREPPPIVSTEFSRVGGTDQAHRSREMIVAHLDAFAHGMTQLYYFNQMNNSGILDHPFLREPTQLGGNQTQTSGFMFMQWVDRPRVSAALRGEHRWRAMDGRGSIMPILQTMTYYHLVQLFDLAVYRETVRPDDNTIAYIFDRDDATIIAIWQERETGIGVFAVTADAEYTVQDFYGRKDRLRAGQSVISVGPEPRYLVFDRPVETIDIAPAAIDIAPLDIVRGSSADAHITLPGGLWGDVDRLTVAATIDGTWPPIADQTLDARRGATLNFPVEIASDRAAGRYPLTVRLSSDDAALAGLLRVALDVRDLLRVELSGIPLTHQQQPGIEVTIRNYGPAEARGIARFEDRYFAEGLRSELRQAEFSSPPGGATRLVFPVAAKHVNLGKSYDIRAEVLDTETGRRVVREAEIAFRAAERAPGPITIDGDLSDWKLDERTAIPFVREFTGWGGRAREGDDDLSGRFWVAWDDDRLYFAVKLRDDSAVVRHNTVSIWPDDNIMLGLYPWGWRKGESLMPGYYREHLGPCADGQARIFRVGNVAVGPTEAEGAEIEVVRTDGGWIYEWSYPAAALAPLELKPGSRFRLSMYAIDRDWEDEEKGELKGRSFIAILFGGFNTNVDAKPEKWREFILTE